MARKTTAPLLLSASLPVTPLGPLRLKVTDRGVARLEFLESPDEPDAAQPEQLFAAAPLLLLAIDQLRDYMDGRQRDFHLPIDWRGMSPFQERVLKLALEIPYGETRSYGELANNLGQPGSSRAVGMALGKNPLPIIIPCHRVLSNQGHLQGYSAPDGLRKKPGC